MDTPVQADSIQFEAQLPEGKECSFETGDHTLSACGGQGAKAAVALHFMVMITRVLAVILV